MKKHLTALKGGKMRFLTWMVGFALLFTSHTAFVQGRDACDPCDPCNMDNSCNICDLDFCDTEFSAYVDALYWKFCRSDLDYGKGNEDGGYVGHDWQWGFRVGGVASLNEW